MKPIRILSLGAGVQSTTVLLMACLGEIEPINHAIFADTGWEPKAVMEHLAWLERWIARVGVPVHHVKIKRKGTLGNIKDDCLRYMTGDGEMPVNHRWHAMPFFVLNPDGSKGMIQRQCTAEYKIDPINRKIRELMGLKTGQRRPKKHAITKIFGISYDEAHRMRRSVGPWEEVEHPLLDLRMTRLDCLKWCEDHGFPRPPRSSCIGCPFHSDQEWAAMQRDRPEEFADAVEVDRAIRDGGDGIRGKFFLHGSLKPLDQVHWNLDPTPDMFGNECMGLCGT